MFNVNEAFEELMLEKRTREQYAIDKWKKKYNFEPTDKWGMSGFITVDGKKYKVHLSKGKQAMVDGVKVPGMEAMIGAVINQDNSSNHPMNNTQYTHNILINDDFFKLKGGKRRDALLQHEIGHIKNNHYNDVKNKVDEINHGNNNERKKVVNHINNNLLNNVKHDHLNFEEIEADRYADNKVGGNYLKRALRNSYALRNRKGGVNTNKGRNKLNKALGVPVISDPRRFARGKMTQSEKEDDKFYRAFGDAYNIPKYLNTKAQEDMKYRSKALKDKTIQNASYLK